MRRAGVIAAVVLGGGAALVLLIVVALNSGGSGGQAYQVRAIFDNAGFAVPGEQVRIAGAPVGSISSLSVTRLNQAAVTFTVNNSAFTPFHADATCTIRPQSLIAERYVDCDPGTAAAPRLPMIHRGQGAGAHLLPVTQTSSPIDPDIVQSIWQLPIRQRLALILNELGTGLAARGADLGAAIRRADPALGYTDQVFKILAAQNRELAQLATDSDTVLAPLAGVRSQIASFVVHANTTASASAARSAALSRSIKLLPSFLSRLRPLMAALGELADQGTPLMRSLGQAATGLNRQFAELTPFAKAARTALIDLGNAAHESQGPLLATLPLARQLGSLGAAAKPSSSLLDRLTASLNNTGAIEQLMGVLFNGTGATNAFDANGHYVRAAVIFGSCTGYARAPVPVCSANFSHTAASGDAAASGDVGASGAGGASQAAGTGKSPGANQASGAGQGAGGASASGQPSSSTANTATVPAGRTGVSAGTGGAAGSPTVAGSATAGGSAGAAATTVAEAAEVAAVVRQALRASGPLPRSPLAGLLSFLTGAGG
jgi:phospholipid/cholesterol/gamma-HCH transport system substrate-binding protein